MGTNFYLKRHITGEKVRELQEMLGRGEYQEVSNELNEYLEPVHIGKRSGGWKFLWNANNFQYFQPSKESLFEFLKTGQIISEYGTVFDFEGFLVEISDCLESGHDMESYHREYPEEKSVPRGMCYQVKIDAFNRNYPINVNKYGEFYIDNLLFTIDCHFS